MSAVDRLRADVEHAHRCGLYAVMVDTADAEGAVAGWDAAHAAAEVLRAERDAALARADAAEAECARLRAENSDLATSLELARSTARTAMEAVEWIAGVANHCRAVANDAMREGLAECARLGADLSRVEGERIDQLIAGVEWRIGGDGSAGAQDVSELRGLLTDLLCARLNARGAVAIVEHGEGEGVANFTASIGLSDDGETLGAVEGHGRTPWVALVNLALISGAWIVAE